eukprot:11192313-Lingulodinium_polyedra.AAC.1
MMTGLSEAILSITSAQRVGTRNRTRARQRRSGGRRPAQQLLCPQRGPGVPCGPHWPRMGHTDG